MKYLIFFINWVIRTSYYDSVVKNKNIIDNSILSISFLFTDIIGFAINFFVYFFNLSRPKPFFYFIIYIVVFVLIKFYLMDKKRLKCITQQKPDNTSFLIYNIMYFFTAILFFASLALIYKK